MSFLRRSWIGALLALVLGGAGAAAVWFRRRSAVQDAAKPEPRDVSPDDPAEKIVDRSWSCECGQSYRITGEGRHRVYWRSDASVADPVIDGTCTSCERPLPSMQAA